MAHDKNPGILDDRRKAQEEEYFRKQNAALAQKLKDRETLKSQGISDDHLIEELTKAGFGADAARALVFVPLIQMAWADGRVQDEERQLIEKLAGQRGIELESEAMTLIQRWMSSEPRDERFLQAKALLEPMVEEIRRSGGAELGAWISSAAEKVAEATGGLFGFGAKISKEEKELLKEIANRFQSE
jgi:hypothetical protein